MWKYGGVYSDLDTISLKSFNPLIDERKNGIGDLFENNADIGNGLMIFQPKLPYILYLMKEFYKNYNGNEWAINGPQLLAKTLLDFCNIDNIHSHLLPGYKKPQGKTFYITKKTNLNQNLVYLDKKHKCANLNIFPHYYFYPILFYKTEFLKNSFTKNSTYNENYWKVIKNSYSIHFYNKLTSMQITKPSDKSFYSELAARYCDFTYDYVKKKNFSFDSV